MSVLRHIFAPVVMRRIQARRKKKLIHQLPELSVESVVDSIRRSSSAMASWPSEMLFFLVGTASFHTVPPSEVLSYQNEMHYTSGLIILVQGSAAATHRDGERGKAGRPHRVALIAPAVISENVVLAEGVCSATIATLETCTIAKISSRNFWTCLSRKGTDRRTIDSLRTLFKEFRRQLFEGPLFSSVAVVQRSWLFAGLSSSDTEDLCRRLELRSLLPGDVVTKEHESFNSVCFLVRGAIDVTSSEGLAETVTGAAAFGEMSVVFRDARQCTTVARTPVDMWLLTEKSLSAWTAADPRRRFLLLQRVARKRLRWLADVRSKNAGADLRQLLGSIPFLAHCKGALRDELIALAKPRIFPPGGVITEKGAPCDGLYVLHRGKAACREKEPSTLTAGDTLGEFCLRPHYWMSTFVAETVCDMFHFPSEDLKATLKKHRVFVQAEDVCKLGLDMFRRRVGAPVVDPMQELPPESGPGPGRRVVRSDDYVELDTEGWKRLLPLQHGATSTPSKRATDARMTAVLQRLVQAKVLPEGDDGLLIRDPDFPEPTTDQLRRDKCSLLLTHRSQSLGMLVRVCETRTVRAEPPSSPSPVRTSNPSMDCHNPPDVESVGPPTQENRRGRRSAPSSTLLPRPPPKQSSSTLPPRPTTTGSLHVNRPPEVVDLEEISFSGSSHFEQSSARLKREFDGELRAVVAGTSLRPFSAGNRRSLDRFATVDTEMMVGKEVRVPVKQQDALWCLELDDDDDELPAVDDSKPVALFLHIVSCEGLTGMDGLVEPIVRVQTNTGKILLRTAAMSAELERPVWKVDEASCISCINDKCVLEFVVCDNVVDDEPAYTASMPIAELAEGARQLHVALAASDARAGPASITVSVIIIPSDDAAAESSVRGNASKNAAQGAGDSLLFVQVIGCDLPRSVNAVMVVMDDSGKQLVRSAVSYNTSAPRWVDLSGQLPIVGGFVSFELWEDNAVVASATEEVDALAFAGVGKKSLTLFPAARRTGPSKPSKAAFGSVNLSILAIQAAAEQLVLALPKTVTIVSIAGYDAQVCDEPRDPFLVATVEGTQVIRTPIERQTACPRWDMATTSSVITVASDTEMFVQAFDGEEANVLGYGVMPFALANQKIDETIVNVSLPLSDGSTVHLNRTTVALTDATSRDEPTRRGDPQVLIVHVARCDNLVDAGVSDFSADPIVTIRFPGQKYLMKSTAQSSTQNPRWAVGSATAAIATGDAAANHETLIVEIWDGSVNFQDFLGCVRIDMSRLSHGETTLPLRPHGEQDLHRALGSVTLVAFRCTLNGSIVKPPVAAPETATTASSVAEATPARQYLIPGALHTPHVAPARPVQIHISSIVGLPLDSDCECWVVATDADDVALVQTTKSSGADPSWAVGEGSSTLDLTSLVQNAPVTFEVFTDAGFLCGGTLNPWELATWEGQQMGLRTVVLEPGDATLCIAVVMKSKGRRK